MRFRGLLSNHAMDLQGLPYIINNCTIYHHLSYKQNVYNMLIYKQHGYILTCYKQRCFDKKYNRFRKLGKLVTMKLCHFPSAKPHITNLAAALLRALLPRCNDTQLVLPC